MFNDWVKLDNKIIIRKSLLKWTPQAIDCYEKKCNCNGCIIHKTIETDCLMKYIVLKIIELKGKPNDNKR